MVYTYVGLHYTGLHSPMNLKLHPTHDNETFAFITLHGGNRHPDVLAWHKRVMVDHWGIPVNYVEAPFPGVSHGWAMNQILGQVLSLPVEERPTYLWWWDNDCIALKREVFDHVYQTVMGKKTVWGQGWQSSHLTGPNGSVQHPYASQACLCFPTELYDALGRPDCHHSERSDTAEELTYQAELRGFTVALQYPSYSETKTTALGNGCWYGRGNIYGPDLTYHESRADLEGHVERFTAKCKEVLDGRYG